MPTSPTSILSEIEISKPISKKTRAFYRRRLQSRIHRLIRKAFREQREKAGLTQKQLADRIQSRAEQINRWLNVPSNLTLDTISDLLLGMAVDLDDPSTTPIVDLVAEEEEQRSDIAAQTDTHIKDVSAVLDGPHNPIDVQLNSSPKPSLASEPLSFESFAGHARMMQDLQAAPGGS